MGILNARPKLAPGEELRFDALANYVGGTSLYGFKAASGGRLVVTDRRVFFTPSRLDAVFSKKPWELPVDAVTGLEVVGKDGTDVFGGGMRDRLGIRTADGVEVFVVNKLDERLADLRPLFPNAAAG
jgi:hypothetical protein